MLVLRVISRLNPMTNPETPELIYLGRSRLHRNRANLIQTLHTVAALTEIGVPTRLYLPPWHHDVSLDQRLSEMGIQTRPDIRPAQLLHRRWPVTAFGRFHRRMLRRARAVYVRSHELSLALASLGIVHHFEVHTLQPLIQRNQLELIVDYQRRGLIDHFIPITHNTARRLIEAGADDRRIHISPSGVDLSAFETIPPLDMDHLAQPRIVYLGRISLDRGLEILSHLAAQGLGEILLVGDCDDPVKPTPHLHHRAAVPHREVPALYNECEMVLLPYQPALIHADGISPMKLFEAMAAGRPIIASDIAAIREILQHGHNALLADPGDPLAWEAAVRQLSQDPALALRLARQAQQDATAYGWKQRATGIARTLGLLQHPH
jgi:glycosyltransferase involved in cell wall biosynthesis